MRKEIKKLSLPEFREVFVKHFPAPNITSVPTNEFPTFLTDSEELRKNTWGVVHVSGAPTFGASKMGFLLYRHDEKEKLKGGSPINVDRYEIETNPLTLFKADIPTEEHKLGSLPNELINLPLKTKEKDNNGKN